MGNKLIGYLVVTCVFVVIAWCLRTLFRFSTATYYSGTGAACGNCGYALTQLHGDFLRCPECGSHVLEGGISTPKLRGHGWPRVPSALFALLVLISIASFLSAWAQERHAGWPRFATTQATYAYDTQPMAGAGPPISLRVSVKFKGTTDGVAESGEVRLSDPESDQSLTLSFDGRVTNSTLAGVASQSQFDVAVARTFLKAVDRRVSANTAEAETTALTEVVQSALTDPFSFTGSGSSTNQVDLTEVLVAESFAYAPRVTLGPLRGYAAIWGWTALYVLLLAILGFGWLVRQRKRYKLRSPAGVSYLELLGSKPTSHPPIACCEAMTRHVNRAERESGATALVADEHGSAVGFLKGIELIQIAHCPWCGVRLNERPHKSQTADTLGSNGENEM